MKKSLNKSVWILFFLCIVAILFRYALIANNAVYFWYDQARDAYVSQEMIRNFDIKIQGPSASGTNDTIYHGVFYYYLLGPLYLVFQGNPWAVAMGFGVMNVLAVVMVYFLSMRVFKNTHIAILAAGLVAVNFEHAQYSTWLSNPMMGLVPIVIFFIAVWQLFYAVPRSRGPAWPVIAGVSLGMVEQSAFYSFYLFGVLVVGLVYLSRLEKKSLQKIFSIQEILAFGGAYGVLIISMVLAQAQLYRAGIFSLESFTSAVGTSAQLANPSVAGELINTYLIKMIQTLTPRFSLLGIAIGGMIGWALFKHFKRPARWFFLSWLMAPIWLFLFHFRNSPHMLVGVEYVLLILFAWVLAKLFQARRWYTLIVGVGLSLLYLGTQFSAVQHIRSQDTSIFTYQTGVLLHNELDLIDRTYELAGGEPFSISVWGSPYEYYITWAYLYDWYGRQKYGYVPNYVGTSQVGKFGPELLNQVTEPDLVHFLIEEPDIVLVGDIYRDYIGHQNAFTTPVSTNLSDEKKYETWGEYRLQLRTVVRAEREGFEPSMSLHP